MVSSQLHPLHRVLKHLYLPSTPQVKSVLHITDKTQHSSAVLYVIVAPPAADVPNVCDLYGIWRLKRKHAGPKLR